MTYWEKRAEDTILVAEKSADEYAKTMKKMYSEVRDEMQSELNNLYAKYAEDEKLELSELKKLLDESELKNFKADIKEMEEELKNLNQKWSNAEFRKNLKDLYRRSRINRLTEFITNIDYQIEKLSTQMQDDLNDNFKTVYEDTYYQSMYNTHQRLKIEVSFTQPSETQLEQAIKTKWHDENFSSRLWINKEKLKRELETTLTRNFVAGRNLQDVSQELGDKLGTDFNSAYRLVRTETNYIANQATMKSYRDGGVVEKYEFLATLDNRTSVICGMMDGQIFNVKDEIVGVNSPPLHPNCRSTTVSHFEDDNIVYERIEQREGGKSKRMKEDMTFLEWVAKYGSDNLKLKHGV